jgi:Uma2 family endonuclease
MATTSLSTRAKQTEPRPLRWTKEQYHKMGEMGLFEGQRVELIEGEIIEMPSMNFPHWKSVVRVRDVLLKIFGASYVVIDQLPISVVDQSEPEPDLAVIPASLESLEGLPSTVSLVIEVSDSTLDTDQGRKLRLYARSEIPEYWIIDVKARQLILHRHPEAAHERYNFVQVLNETEKVAPLEAPNEQIKVADLLP